MSDRHYGISTDGGLTVDHFNPVVLDANDYYPFGSLQPGRTYDAAGAYRYGQNSQERDDEINGPGNSYTAQFWEYDSRIGRRWSLDPRGSIGQSFYPSFNNNPILYVDPMGDTVVAGAGGKTTVNIDERISQLSYYDNSSYTIQGTNVSVPVKQGQLRSFTNQLGTFTAKWSVGSNGEAVFQGYLNDKNQSIQNVVDGIKADNSIIGRAVISFFIKATTLKKTQLNMQRT